MPVVAKEAKARAIWVPPSDDLEAVLCEEQPGTRVGPHHTECWWWALGSKLHAVGVAGLGNSGAQNGLRH